MNKANDYSKQYTSKRKSAEQTEVDHVIIFSCDNSFVVVRSKECAPAEQDGFVLVQSNREKYMGFVFGTGKMRIDIEI